MNGFAKFTHKKAAVSGLFTLIWQITNRETYKK